MEWLGGASAIIGVIGFNIQIQQAKMVMEKRYISFIMFCKRILTITPLESRILCAISCSIGFFGEIVVNFYILSIYHYNNTIFKEGNRDISHKRDKNRNVEISSRNAFLDKKRPAEMKKYNQKLDMDFSS